MCPDAPPPRSPSHAKNPPVFVDNQINCDMQRESGGNDLDMTLGTVTFGEGGSVKKSIIFLDLRPIPF